jgi:hypothetical protein
MKSFRERYPGLNEEQLRIKYKIWERERLREQQLYESLKKKLPFKIKEGDDDTGDYFGDFGSSIIGVASDAPLSGAQITFIYENGYSSTTLTDTEGKFQVPSNFSEGDILVKGGIDTVTGLAYLGELKVDAEFFFKYKVITPLTHLANHIWLNTPTRIPEEAMNIVVNYISEFLEISLPEVDCDTLFNDDHVKLTMEGVSGAKEIQAINTLIEVYSDLISSTQAMLQHQIQDFKVKVLNEIADAFLILINAQTTKKYTDHLFDFHEVTVSRNHKDCCLALLKEASSIIKDSIAQENIQATTTMQALNLLVKDEWTTKAFEMTNDNQINENNIWEQIHHRTPDLVVSSITLPQV